jgi:hypothetical protein
MPIDASARSAVAAYNQNGSRLPLYRLMPAESSELDSSASDLGSQRKTDNSDAEST